MGERMANKDKISDWDSTPANNTDVGGVAITGASSIRLGNDAIQTVMAQTADLNASDTIASVSTTDLGSKAAQYLQITGTTTITAFGTVKAGIIKFVEFAGALTLTHNGTSLILPGAANITTAAGDIAIMVSEGSGNWRCASYQPAGSPQRTLRGTLQSLLSGSQVDFAIPSWAKWVDINFHNVSSSASGNLIVQIGGSGGIETSGYSGSVNVGGTPALLTSSFVVIGTSGATAVASGSLRLSSLDTDTWAAVWQSGFSNSAGVNNGAGSKVISAGALTTVRFATTGTAFDNGVVNILYGG